MGSCFSSLASFTPTLSYVATANGRPMSVKFPPPQQIPTSLSSGSGNDNPPSKPSPPKHGRWKRKRAHPTGRIATLSPQPGKGSLPRAPSHDSHRDATVRTPLPSRSDVPTSPSHSPPGPNTPPHQYQSRGSSGPPRSRSLDAPSRQRSPSPPPHRMASTSSLDGRRSPRPNVEPVLSQDDLPTLLSNQKVPANGSDGRQCLEPTLQNILRDDPRFSILVLGKRDSGKSSVINAVFKVDMSAAPGNVSGDIAANAEFCRRDSRRLTVHEYSGLGPRHLQSIRDFVKTHSHPNLPLSQRLHAIWICVSMSEPDFIDGVFGEGKEILELGVPVVVVFTKFGLLSGTTSADSRSHESASATAHRMSEERCRTFLRRNSADVPFELVSTDSKFGDLIGNLAAKMNRVMATHSRNAPVPPKSQKQLPISPVLLAWSLSQRASRGVIIQATIEIGRSRYWRDLWVTDEFAGHTLEDCIEVIHGDIVGVWDFPDKDGYLSSKAFRDEISDLLQDLSGTPIDTSSKPRPNDTPGAGITTCSGSWLKEPYQNSKEDICCVMGYIVDLTVVLSCVFESTGDVSPESLQLTIKDHVDSGRKTGIHAEICNFVRVTSAFTYFGHDLIMERIIDLITQF